MTLLDLVSSLISCKFLNPNIFFPIFSNLLYLRNLQERVKKHSVTKNCSDLSLLEQIVLVILITRIVSTHSRSEQFW